MLHLETVLELLNDGALLGTIFGTNRKLTCAQLEENLHQTCNLTRSACIQVVGGIASGKARIGSFNLIFYQSAEDAVYKALGVE